MLYDACVILITKEENKDYQVYQNDLKHNLITNQISELNEKKNLLNQKNKPCSLIIMFKKN